jgi:hypothetical protein
MRFNPAGRYDPRDPNWEWDAKKFDMADTDIVESLWRDYNSIANAPLQQLEDFLRDVQRISSVHDTIHEFFKAMKRNSAGRYEALSKRLDNTVREVMQIPDLPINLFRLIHKFEITPSLDNLCDIFEYFLTYPWPPASGDAECASTTAKPQPPALTRKRPREPVPAGDDHWTYDAPYDNTEEDIEEFNFTQRTPPPRWSLPDDFQPGFAVKGRVTEIYDPQITQGSPERPSKRFKSTHDRDSTRG